MPAILPPVCRRCGLSVSGAYDATVVCRRCQESPLTFEQARAPFLYVGMAREMIHAFKYGGHHRIGMWLAAQMVHTAKRELPLTDETIVTPVPMHWVKQRLKGVNPAAFLAHAIAQLLHLSCHRDTLCRTRWTPTQTRLTMRQRFRNVRRAFGVGRRQMQGNTVLLVDDVLTSGATADACAQALRAAGASRVYVLAAACASRP